jgi:hypothetical protein
MNKIERIKAAEYVCDRQAKNEMRLINTRQNF